MFKYVTIFWKQYRPILVGALGLIVFQVLLYLHPPFLSFYIRWLFEPFQWFRSILFNNIRWSLGDVLYCVAILYLLFLLLKLIVCLFTFKRNKTQAAATGKRLIVFVLVILWWFFLGWGGNYMRKPLSSQWLQTTDTLWKDTFLIPLNLYLVRVLNEAQVHQLQFDDLRAVNVKANALFQQKYPGRVATLKVKPSLLGNNLNYFRIHGYYNPFTGEAQYNDNTPAFMHPFVVLHEMAHQAGIAAEDDANLVSYVLGEESNIPTFQYSAHLNLYLYAYGQLKAQDSLMAKKIFEQLNATSKQQWDSLRAINKQFRSPFGKWTSKLYDNYLRLQGQTKGIASYNDVCQWVYYRYFIQKTKSDLEVCP
jgi:hypothetical protein